jgi:hypothetical protein
LWVVNGHVAHVRDKFFIDCESPPEQAQEEGEENHERDYRPKGNVVDILEYIFVHAAVD